MHGKEPRQRVTLWLICDKVPAIYPDVGLAQLCSNQSYIATFPFLVCLQYFYFKLLCWVLQSFQQQSAFLKDWKKRVRETVQEMDNRARDEQKPCPCRDALKQTACCCKWRFSITGTMLYAQIRQKLVFMVNVLLIVLWRLQTSSLLSVML